MFSQATALFCAQVPCAGKPPADVHRGIRKVPPSAAGPELQRFAVVALYQPLDASVRIEQLAD